MDYIAPVGKVGVWYRVVWYRVPVIYSKCPTCHVLLT
jgi:hypothetical protein